MWCPVRCCDLESHLLPFFWSRKVRVTYSASCVLPESWEIMILCSFRKTMSQAQMGLVLPLRREYVNSQPRMAKNQAATTSSAATDCGVSPSLLSPAPEVWKSRLKNFGVSAF